MNTKRRTPFIMALVLGLSMTAWAAAPDSEVTIAGRVTDFDTGAPLASAQVFVEDPLVGVLTRQDGSYTLLLPVERVAAGVEIQVRRIGYQAARERVALPNALAGDVLTRDFQLSEEALELNEIIVTGIPGRPDDRSAAQRPALEPRSDRDSRGLGNTVEAETAHARVIAGSAAPVATLPASAPHWPSGGGRGYDREQYDHFADNDFRAVLDHPLSTFSIDVDRASYSNVRRFIMGEHRAPPVDAVQIEEMINYFPYDYALPEGDDPVGVTTELGVAPWNRDHQLLRIGLASRPIATEDLPPSNFVFLIDVSGSMNSADKLPLVKQSLEMLVEQLRPQDRVAIAVYAGAAGLVLESTPGSRRDRIMGAIDRLEAGGSTAGGAGLRLAYEVARSNFIRNGNNRVIIATDGDFNVGESSDAAMVRLVEERRDQGTFLTVLGFGTGNLQSAKMQGMAQHGNGNYAYIDSRAEARKVLVQEMGGTTLTVAQDVKLQIEFNPEHVREYRLLGYENRLLAAEDFNDDRKDAGELGAGHTVTALYELVPAHGSTRGGRVDPLRYQNRPGRSDQAGSEELAFVRIRYKAPRGTESRLMERPVTTEIDDPSDDFEFASAVAGFGMLLRESRYAGSMTVGRVLSLAEDGRGADLEGHRREFIQMVRTYSSIPHGHR